MDHSPIWADVGRHGLLPFTTAHPEPGAAVVAIRRARPKILVVNVSGVVFLSSKGIGTLLHLHGECRRDGTELVVIASPLVRRVLTVMGLPDLPAAGGQQAAGADRRRRV